MAIYELEERIFFDGAMPADTNEVVDNSSSQEPANSNPEESATAVEPQSDSSTDVSISPETSSDSGDSSDSDSSFDSSDSGDSSDSSDGDTADSSDSLDDLAASLADVQVAPNVIIVSTEDPDYQEILDSADSDAVIVEYDSSDDFDSILQKLKDELGDVSAANIGIVESDKLDIGSAEGADFLNELSNLQISCGEINIIDADGDGLAISDLEKSDDGSWHQVADSTNDYADYFATDFTAATTAEHTTQTSTL